MTELALWKTLHVLGATALLGTGGGIAFFCWFGYRSAVRRDEIAVLRAVLRLTVIADAVFTAPAVVLQAVSGLMLVHLYGWPLFSPWSLWVWGLFLFVGACWLPVVALQIRLRDEADAAASIAALSPQFHRRFRLWFALGIPAFTTVLALVYLMVAKPLAVT